jgi:hypothetical protein
MDVRRISVTDLVAIVVAAGKKPRHAQNVLLRHVVTEQVAITSDHYIEDSEGSVSTMLLFFFAKYKIDYDKLIDHPELSFEIKQRLYQLTV